MRAMALSLAHNRFGAGCRKQADPAAREMLRSRPGERCSPCPLQGLGRPIPRFCTIKEIAGEAGNADAMIIEG